MLIIRWAFRYAKCANSDSYYDWNLHTAEEGYIILTSRLRRTEEVSWPFKCISAVVMSLD